MRVGVVQAARRLISKNEPCTLTQGHGNCRPLPLTAGHARGVLLGKGSDAQFFEHRDRTRTATDGRLSPRHRNILPDGQSFENRARLRDEGDVAPPSGNIRTLVPAVEGDISLAGPENSRDAGQECRFPRTGRTDQGGELRSGRGECDTTDSPTTRPVFETEAVDFQHSGCHPIRQSGPEQFDGERTSTFHVPDPHGPVHRDGQIVEGIVDRFLVIIVERPVGRQHVKKNRSSCRRIVGGVQDRNCIEQRSVSAESQ